MDYNQYGYSAQPSNIVSRAQTDIQGVRRVANIDEVYATSIPYGSRIMFMHHNEPYFYVKEGSAVETYKFEKVEPPKPENFVTRQEFDELRSMYESLVSQQQYAATAAVQRIATPTTTTVQPATIQPDQSNATIASNPELQGNSGASQATTM